MKYFDSMWRGLQMEELVAKHASVMERYDPEENSALVVGEWGGQHDVEPGTNAAFLCQQNFLRDTMIAGVTLDVRNNHADRGRMANLAQTVNVLQAGVLTKLNYHPSKITSFSRCAAVCNCQKSAIRGSSCGHSYGSFSSTPLCQQNSLRH